MYGPTSNCVYGASDAEELLFVRDPQGNGMGILPLLVPLIGAAAAIGGPMLAANMGAKQAKKDQKAQQKAQEQAMQLQLAENERVRAHQSGQIQQLGALAAIVGGLFTAYKILGSALGSAPKKRRRR